MPLSIIIAGVLIAGGIYLNGRTVKGSPLAQQQNLTANIASTIRPIDQSDHILGSPDSRVLIVEYSDTECPYCKIFHNTMSAIMRDYGRDGRVAWVYRHYPMKEIHTRSFKEAEATECAASLGGESKFWEYVNLLYETTPSNDQLDPQELPKIAVKVGLSSQDFSACLESGQFAAKVNADVKNAQDLKIIGTPHSFLIDTKTNEYYPLEGYYAYERLKLVIDMILGS